MAVTEHPNVWEKGNIFGPASTIAPNLWEYGKTLPPSSFVEYRRLFYRQPYFATDDIVERKKREVVSFKGVRF